MPNPGQIGIGVVLVSPQGMRHEKSERTGIHGCNNVAELQALCALLALAKSVGAMKLLVRGDSDNAVRYALGLDNPAVPAIACLVLQAQAQLRQFEAVQLQWVPRHRNTEADRLCRLALGLPQKPAIAKKPGRKKYGRRK